MEYKIALIGCGTVGRGLLEILERKREFLRDACDFDVLLVAVSDKLMGSVCVPEGIDIHRLLDLIGRGKTLNAYDDPRAHRVEIADPLDMIEKCGADIVAELTTTDIRTGEPAASYIRKALRTGMHVVTTNKGPAALHHRELADLARTNGLQFRIEGTVMSGTPVFHLIENGLAGNGIREIRGILNGTTNFILSRMEQDGLEYGEALKLAQEAGYAEADPTADVEGFDAAAKVLILSNVVLGGSLAMDDVPRTGISGVTKALVHAAKAEGARYKLVCRTRKDDGKIDASVRLEKLLLSDPLAGIMDAKNAMVIETDLLGTIFITGPGAGKTETGAAVLSDLLAIHKCRKA
jgi:homoserine dehydrogenase